MALVHELKMLLERCKQSSKEEALTRDLYDKIGLILREATYIDFDPLDEEKGTYMVSINIAGKEIMQINTKLDENGNVVFDNYEVDEGGIRALIEFIENKAHELQNQNQEG